VKKLITIGYCGKKDEQPDLVAGTGLTWGPGISYNVTPEQAAILLVHTDSWVHEGEVEIAEAATAPVTPAKKDEKKDEEPFVKINLANMTKAQLVAHAHRTHGVMLDPDTLTKAQLSEKITQLANGARVTS
jgi:hypothetical protein